MTSTKPSFVGPHEGHELELMKAGLKPLGMFVEPVNSGFEFFPEEEFDKLVCQRKMVKHVVVETLIGDRVQERNILRVLYAIPGEEWRINALMLVQHLYDTLIPGRRPDLERVIGLLLGYERADIEKLFTLDFGAARRKLMTCHRRDAVC